MHAIRLFTLLQKLHERPFGSNLSRVNFLLEIDCSPYATIITQRDGTQTCYCQACTNEDYSQVCASDGVTYGNLCEMKYQACLKNEDISLRNEGSCELDSLLDVVFILDGSDAVDVATWSQMKRYVLEMTSSFRISPRSVRVGIVIAGKTSKVVLKLTEGEDLKNLLQSLSKADRVGGKLDLESAFEKASQQFDKTSKSAKVVIPILAGDDIDRFAINKQVENLLKQDIVVKTILLSDDGSVESSKIVGDILIIKDTTFFPNAISFIYQFLTETSGMIH